MRIFRLHADCYQPGSKIKIINMSGRILLIPLILFFTTSYAQQEAIHKFLSDSSMNHAFVSLYIVDADKGDIIAEINPDKSLTQASVMKLVTSSASIELLGSDYRFKTILAYSGTIKKSTNTLDGDIIIQGGGDPCLGSNHFQGHYGNFIEKWREEISQLGIKRIRGRVVSDDSYFDYQPIPAKWSWEDIGNYYGAGAYGLSISDNTIKIHFKTGAEGSIPVLTYIEPTSIALEFKSYLKSSGNSDEGYVFSAPYNKYCWIAGSIPVEREDFVLNASIPDPPMFTAELLEKSLKEDVTFLYRKCKEFTKRWELQ